MLRLPRFELEKPTSLDQAIDLLRSSEGKAMIIAGGTDLLPNLKHELFEPELLVSLEAVPELRGVRRDAEGFLRLGAMTTIADVASSELVSAHAPALSQAASVISGPQLRTMGTLGGNVMLDTRCQWYNQTYFWRQALGFCMKKDGTLCHVVEGGKKCVAAASNDTAPALMTLGATLEIVGPGGRRSVPINEFWVADGIENKKLEPGEILTEIVVPPTISGHRGAYGKLRDRGSIDFPLLGVAVRLDTEDDVVLDTDIVLVAIAARPVRVRRARELLEGRRIGTEELDRGIDEVAEAARAQVRTVPNIPGDSEYRSAMVPVFIRRTLRASAAGDGPVQLV